jgi:tetratricopeptide (TPR) repeat protein
VSATFALGYGQLDPRQARAFRLLSLPAGSDISVLAAAALLDMGPLDMGPLETGTAAEAEDLLESLVDASLLEAPAPGRYRFHDLLKLFARRQAEISEEPAARTLALRRLLGCYLASARSAHRLAYEGSAIADNLMEIGATGHDFSSADESAAWLSIEAEDLFATIGQAAETPAVDPSAAPSTATSAPSVLLPAADLLLAMEPLLESGTTSREFEQRTTALLATARRIDDPRAELRGRYVLGRVHFGANRLTEAEQEFLAARALGESTGDHIVLGETYNALAVVAGRRRRHTEALTWFDCATKVYREVGNPAGEALVLSYSARDHLGLGHPEAAIAASEQGLGIFTSLGSRAGVARARYHLGIVLSFVGRLDEAVAHHTECLGFFRASNQRVWEQRVCCRLATTLIAAGRFADAVRHAEQALAVSHEITHPYGEGQSLAALGTALCGMGDAARGGDALRKALDIFIQLGSPEADDVRRALREVDEIEN